MKRLGMFRYKSGSQEIALERVNYEHWADGEVIAEFSFISKLASVGSGNSGTLFPEILARSAAAGHTSSNFR